MNDGGSPEIEYEKVPEFDSQADSEAHAQVHQYQIEWQGKVNEWTQAHYLDHVRLGRFAWVQAGLGVLAVVLLAVIASYVAFG